MFKDHKPDEIENWVCVLERSTKLELEMAKNYLSNLMIPSNILSKQDSSYNLGVGDMALAYLYVPIDFEKKARKALEELENSDFDTEEGEGIE